MKSLVPSIIVCPMNHVAISFRRKLELDRILLHDEDSEDNDVSHLPGAEAGCKITSPLMGRR